MTIDRTRPVRPPITDTKAARNRRIAREQARVEKAAYRKKLVDFAQRSKADNPNQAYGLLVQAISQGVLPGPLPHKATFYRWLPEGEDWRAEKSLHTALDGGRSGRPRTSFDDRVEDFLNELILRDYHPSIAALHREVERFTTNVGLEAPSIYRVRRYVEETPRVKIAAARHGSRAALADALPKATVPTEGPHEVWTMDELTSPVWIKAFHPQKRRWVSIKPHLIVLMDVHSRVLLSYQVVEPFRENDTHGYGSKEILGAFFSAALPELACPASREFTGFLPHSFRLDNHPSHSALRKLIADHFVEVPRMPSYRPWHRGDIERLVQTLKGLCYSTLGYEEAYRPIDKVGAHPKDERSKRAAMTSREAARIEIPVDRLLTVQQFRSALDSAVDEYHKRPHGGLGGQTPEMVYHETLARERSRDGYDAILMLPPTQLTVSREGLVLSKRAFAWESGGRELQIGDKAICRVDPMKRGLFAKIGGLWTFLPPKEDWAKSNAPGEFSWRQNIVARDWSDAAAEARQRMLVEATDSFVVREVEEALEEQIVAANWAKREARRVKRLTKLQTSPAAEGVFIASEPISAEVTGSTTAYAEPKDGTARAPSPRGIVRDMKALLRAVR